MSRITRPYQVIMSLITYKQRLDPEIAISKRYLPISMKIETNLLQVILSHFSKFPGGENFFGFLANFRNFFLILQNWPKIQKNFPHLEISRSDSESPKDGWFQFSSKSEDIFWRQHFHGPGANYIIPLIISYRLDYTYCRNIHP